MWQAQVFTLYPEFFPGPLSKGNLKGMSDKGIPPELFNQLK